jgi:hypothetical protein
LLNVFETQTTAPCAASHDDPTEGYYVLYSLEEAAVERLSGELGSFLTG